MASALSIGMGLKISRPKIARNMETIGFDDKWMWEEKKEQSRFIQRYVSLWVGGENEETEGRALAGRSGQ